MVRYNRRSYTHAPNSTYNFLGILKASFHHDYFGRQNFHSLPPLGCSSVRVGVFSIVYTNETKCPIVSNWNRICAFKSLVIQLSPSLRYLVWNETERFPFVRLESFSCRHDNESHSYHRWLSWFFVEFLQWIGNMAPKDDPETAALKKELTDMIEKFKVNFRICNENHDFSLNWPQVISWPIRPLVQNFSVFSGRANKSCRLFFHGKMSRFRWYTEMSFCYQEIAQRPYQQSEFRALCRGLQVFSTNIFHSLWK